MRIRPPRNDNWLTGLEKCQECSLCATRKRVIPGQGQTEDPKLFMVMDVIHAEEDDTGRRLSRIGADVLNAQLRKLGLVRQTDCYLTSVIKCIIPEDRLPQGYEINACRPYLDKEYFDIKPKRVVLMGQGPVDWWFPAAKPAVSMRGQVYENELVKVVVTYSPEMVVENPGLTSRWEADWELIGTLFR